MRICELCKYQAALKWSSEYCTVCQYECQCVSCSDQLISGWHNILTVHCWAHVGLHENILLSVEPVVADADVAIWDFYRRAIIFLMSGCRGGRVIHWPSIRICSLWLRESTDVTLHSNLYISQIFWRSQKISRLFVVCAWCVGSLMGGRGRGKEALCKLIHGHGLTRNIVTWGLTLDWELELIPNPCPPGSSKLFQIAGSMPSSLNLSSSHSFLSILDFSLKEVLIGSFYLVISGNTF